MAPPSARKLLVLDVNGLLVATYHKQHDILPGKPHHVKLGNFYVYERPGCEEFLDFCFENFVVGIWSSAREHNVSNLVDYILKNRRSALAFSWHQMHCTKTKVMHPDNRMKPIFLKELSKLWDNLDFGNFGPSNSLLVDDSPYKALKNPPHTGIFPRTYTGSEADDNFLGLLRTYLEGVRDTLDVQKYVSENPIGEPSITSESPLWGFFSSIITGATQGIADAFGSSQQSQEYSNQLKPETIEWQDMEPAGRRRQSAPSWVTADSNRPRVQGSQVVSEQCVREHDAEPATHRRHESRNWHELENGTNHSSGRWGRERERSPRRWELERERSPRRDRCHGDPARDTSEFVVQPCSSYTWERNAKRDVTISRNWHKDEGLLEAPLSRDSFGRQYSEHHDRGRARSSQGERQSYDRGALQPPFLSTREPVYSFVPPPILSTRSWGNVERAHPYCDNFRGGRHFSDAAPSTRPEYDRRWQEPVSSGRRREYDSRWSRSPLNQYTAPPRPEYDTTLYRPPSNEYRRSYHPAEGNAILGPHDSNLNWDPSDRYCHTPYSSTASGFQ